MMVTNWLKDKDWNLSLHKIRKTWIIDSDDNKISHDLDMLVRTGGFIDILLFISMVKKQVTKNTGDWMTIW